MSTQWRGRVGAAVAVLVGAVGVLTSEATAQVLPPQEPGVTLRIFQLGSPPTALCPIRSGSTPNVDKLMPTIDYASAADFGASDNFISQVLANLTAPTAGQYTFRLTSDDGSRLLINSAVVVDNDGLHGATAKDGAVTLTAGRHDLRIDHFDASNDQALRLEWKVPGSDSFVLVPTSALSTEANVVRVTSPGSKACEGAEDSAGDGLRLATVNPNYTLTNLRPPGFEPHVSGMDFLPDGRMVITTAGDVSAGGWTPNPESGEVYVLNNVTGSTSAAQVTYTRVAGGLRNPMGIQVIGDKWYVSERGQLTELSADGPDEDTLMEKRTLVTWPNGGNFHEFAFGLLHDDDYFYVARSVAINNGGATTNPQPGQNAGTFIKISRSTWQVSTVAGGLRTPNGVGFGPEGGIFVNDNQGAWLPANKMVQIKQDRFFNHFNTPAGPFDSKPVTQPVLWMPHNEAANSPSNPVLIKDGEFKGQMLWGDVTYGGLQRGFLEKVGGEFQGAVFRHSAGLESGVNRTIIGPDGAIYVGGIGEGGNWGESGKLRFGLQKLAPNGGNVFDMATMKVTRDGFDVSYTQPISEATVAKLAGAYRIKQWRYVPTTQYGGPKVDEETLAVTGATVSADRKTVSLKIDGLKPGRVVHLRSPRPFAAENGQPLWNTEAWYTLNSLPGYVEAAKAYYEAEAGQLGGSAAVQTEHSGYSGSGFVGGFQNVGAALTFTVDVDAADTYPVNLRYANGPNPSTKDKSIAIYVNDVKVSDWTLPTTSPTDWKSWQFATRDLALNAGTNRISLRYETGNDGNLNFDALTVGKSKDQCAPAGIEEGYAGLFDGTLESLTKWRLAGSGSFGRQTDCSILSNGGLGLLWYTGQEFANYSLKLDWKLVKDDNGGVFVGFPNPGTDPNIAINQGYEVQIDATDVPDRTTGSIYTFKGADAAAVAASLNPLGDWNAYEIQVQGQNIKVFLNGIKVNDFTSTDPARDLARGFVGVQNHGAGETVSYRNIRIRTGAIVEPPPGPVITIPGNLQSELGCTADWAPDCLNTQMWDTNRDGVYEFTTNRIPAGNWEYKIAYNQSWTENYGAGGIRDGANIPLTVAANGQVVTFKYNLSTRIVTVELGYVDQTPPTATATLNPALPDWTGGYTSPVTVTFAGQDESPGAVTFEYRVDGGAWTAYTAPVVISTPGPHTVEYRAKDAAGNVSAVAAKTFNITQLSGSPVDFVGDVPATLGVALGAPATFGAFQPGVPRDYTASTTALVTSTGAEATLSVSDPSATHTGKLVNGSFALAQPLGVRVGTGVFAALGGVANPTALTAFDRPVSGAAVPIDFRQTIGANEGLRTGSYSKTLTFTLSTTTP